MQARAVDLVRVAPPPNARPSADATEPKPRTRFEDELNRRTQAKNEPKADAAKPEPAAKAKPRRDNNAKRVDDAPPADAAEAADDAGAVEADDAAAEAEESTETKESTKAKPTKKPDAKKGEAEDDLTDDAAMVADASQPVALLTAGPTAEGDELAIDADAAKGDAGDGDADAATDVDAGLDPDAAAAAQLVAEQAAATSAAHADPTAVTTESAEAFDAVAAATAKPSTAQPTTGQAAATDEPAEAQPHHARAAKATDADATDVNADAEAAGAFQLPPEAETSAASALKKDDLAAMPAALQPAAAHEKSAAPTPLPPTAAAQPTPVRDPAEHNVDKIVTSVRGELLTKGGTMDIRLDPPTLGQIQVQITVEDGVLSANLQTNNDEATRLLSHNLAQLKSQLESAGVSVDRIQVKQATPAEQSNQSNQGNAEGDPRQQSAASQDQSARQEQQRREALQRMWARVAGNGDPLDLVA